MRDVISGTIGILLLLGFLGVMVFWIKSVPLTVIVVLSLVVMLYDFIKTMRESENGS